MMHTRAIRRSTAWLAAGLLATLAACSSVDKADKPTPLKAVAGTLQPQRAWSTGLGGASPKLLLGLAPATDGRHVFAAGAKGQVVALDAATGKQIWRRALKALLSGGPGVGGGLVLVGSADGDVFALDSATGKDRWHVRVNAEILSAPIVGGNVVVLRTVDGRLHGYNVADGEQRWVTEQQVPRLTLRGNSDPVVAGDFVLAGFDNGRLMAVTIGGGITAWDIALGQPHGSSELQRLIDVDAPPVVDGDEVYAVSFQGRAARLSLETGREIWGHEISSYRGLALGPISVFVSTAEGDLVRLDRAGGGERWRQKLLAHRRLTAPAVLGGSVVVGDNLGMLHWLDADTGEFQARVKAGASMSVAPVVAAGFVIIQTDKGNVEAWRPAKR
jgi:outer membrane protein assembly factor BamB